MTAHKTGTAIIKATTVDGGFIDECKVVVAKLATGITISNNSLELKTNETATLTATVQPDGAYQEVTWISGNTNIATICQWNGYCSWIGQYICYCYDSG